jgi:glucose dehydrogenase
LRSAWMTLAGIMVPALLSQAAPPQKDADWPMFNRDLAGTRYSPLTQINTANVATLTKAWLLFAGWPAGLEIATTPPRIILTTARKMTALNARTGKIDPGFGHGRGSAADGAWP